MGSKQMKTLTVIWKTHNEDRCDEVKVKGKAKPLQNEGKSNNKYDNENESKFISRSGGPRT